MIERFDSKRSLEIQKEMFDFSKTSPRKGSWWWWFLVLIFNNPENESRPRQLMILWSTKKDKEIECNDLKIVLDHNMKKESKGKMLDGAVASWYYDGKKMWHNFLLEQTPLIFSRNGVKTEPTSTDFHRTRKGFELNIGKDINFKLFLKDKNIFTMPAYDSKEILGLNYEILRINKLDLTGFVHGGKVYGHAYIQKVFLNSPAIPWYWGIFYFKNGSMLKYFKPHLGKIFGEIPIKKDIQFYHNGELHKIHNIKIKKTIENELPMFTVRGENERIDIMFKVVPYSESHWKFRKRILDIGAKSTFIWHEYPSTIEKIRFLDKKTNTELTEEDLGIGIGNAEYSYGFMV